MAANFLTRHLINQGAGDALTTMGTYAGIGAVGNGILGVSQGDGLVDSAIGGAILGGAAGAGARHFGKNYLQNAMKHGDVSGKFNGTYFTKPVDMSDEIELGNFWNSSEAEQAFAKQFHDAQKVAQQAKAKPTPEAPTPSGSANGTDLSAGTSGANAADNPLSVTPNGGVSNTVEPEARGFFGRMFDKAKNAARPVVNKAVDAVAERKGAFDQNIDNIMSSTRYNPDIQTTPTTPFRTGAPYLEQPGGSNIKTQRVLDADRAAKERMSTARARQKQREKDAANQRKENKKKQADMNKAYKQYNAEQNNIKAKQSDAAWNSIQQPGVTEDQWKQVDMLNSPQHRALFNNVSNKNANKRAMEEYDTFVNTYEAVP